jgi:hypothetical protein
MTNGRFSKRLMALGSAAICLVIVGPALAAHPKNGKKYAGVTSEAALMGFKPPVHFKVSSNGQSILGFKWAGAGCLGGISVGPGGNPWTSPGLNHLVGTVHVAANGTFSVMNLKSSRKIGLQKTVTTSSVKGSFKTAGKAVGTITYKQKVSGGGVTPTHCGPKKVKFRATAM